MFVCIWAKPCKLSGLVLYVRVYRVWMGSVCVCVCIRVQNKGMHGWSLAEPEEARGFGEEQVWWQGGGVKWKEGRQQDWEANPGGSGHIGLWRTVLKVLGFLVRTRLEVRWRWWRKWGAGACRGEGRAEKRAMVVRNKDKAKPKKCGEQMKRDVASGGGREAECVRLSEYSYRVAEALMRCIIRQI